MTKAELVDALKDATAHLNAAASAYRTYARRSSTLADKAKVDPFFSTRVQDFEKAAERATAALRKEVPRA